MSERVKAAVKTPDVKAVRAASQRHQPERISSCVSPYKQVIHLQRTIGNQAARRVIQGAGFWGRRSGGRIQAKLTIGRPNDIYEQEADRVADQVMRVPQNTGISGQHSAISEDNDSIRMMPGWPFAKGPACGEEEVVQPKLLAISPLVQRQVEEDEEEPVQMKRAEGRTPSLTSAVESSIAALKGSERSMPEAERAFFEPRFGRDFSSVRVHADSQTRKLATTIQARAFTSGCDIFFNQGEYQPGSAQGRRLLGHELIHVVQQGSASRSLQRQYVTDTGFRYSPPASVTRSIVEIQGIVGTTPDGVYGENTRIAVEKYQTKLKAIGFYSDTLDGKWGENTETAHAAFAIAPNVARRGYNCTGFALKDYKYHSRAATKAIYSSINQPSSCSNACKPYQYKFWLWEFTWQGTQPRTRMVADFHTVGGQTGSKGTGPSQVMSKDGERPVEGPKPPMDWEPKSGPGIDQITGRPIPNTHKEVSNVKLECYCADTLP